MEPESPVDVLHTIGRRVAELRAERRRTQAQLAEELDVTLQYLQRIEAGRENLTVRSLVRLATALQVRTADFFKPPRTREVRVGRPRKEPPGPASPEQSPAESDTAQRTVPKES